MPQTDDPNEPDEQRLADLDDTIDRARHAAEEHGTIPSDDHEQTLADPDGDGETDPYRVQTGG